MWDNLSGFLHFVGVYALLWYLYENLRSPAQLLLYRLHRLLGHAPKLVLKERFGEWAAITGATDGIGKAYARELARRGLNVLLISRTEAKLRQVAEDIEKDFGVKARWIVADFSQGPEVYKHIERQLEDLVIGILVNNVGQNTPRLDFLANHDEADIWAVMNTNVVPVTILSRFFLRRMRRQGVRGLIVNISSMTEMEPVPYGLVYAASKAYTRSLTLALQREARPWGIRVQLVSPGFVVTKINHYSSWLMRGAIGVPQPDEYARWAVGTMGKVDVTSGYLWHGVQVAIQKMVPWQVRTAMATILVRPKGWLRS